MELTTLELAEQIAAAVRLAVQPQGSAPFGDAPVQAVLRVLAETGYSFCRYDELRRVG